jgi:hypothetical protein
MSYKEMKRKKKEKKAQKAYLAKVAKADFDKKMEKLLALTLKEETGKRKKK